jgi:CBS domain-containing protein
MLKRKLNRIRVKKLMRGAKKFVSPKEKLSSVIGKLKKHKKCALPVKKGKKYKGLVVSQVIAYEDLPPTITKTKSLIINPPLISPDTSLAEACEKMWRNNLIAIPIGKNKKLKGILTFWNIVDWGLKQKEFKKLKVDEIRIREFPVVDIHEEVDKTRVKLRNKELTKILVKDENITKATGIEYIVDKISKIPKEKMTKGDRKGEKYKRLGIETRSISRIIKVKIKERNSIQKLLKKMKKFYSSYALVGESLITFKDILRFLGELKEDILTKKVIFITKTKFFYLTWDQMKNDLIGFLETYHKKFGKDSIREFRITIRDLHKKGSRMKFIMSGKLLTDLGDFYAKKEGWDPIDVFDDLIEAIRRQIWP